MCIALTVATPNTGRCSLNGLHHVLGHRSPLAQGEPEFAQTANNLRSCEPTTQGFPDLLRNFGDAPKNWPTFGRFHCMKF